MLMDSRFAYDDKYEAILSWSLVEAYIGTYDGSATDMHPNGANSARSINSDDIDSFFASATNSSPFQTDLKVRRWKKK